MTLELRIKSNFGERWKTGDLDYDYLRGLDSRNGIARSILLEMLNQCPDGSVTTITLVNKIGAPGRKFKYAITQLTDCGILLRQGDRVAIDPTFRKDNSERQGLGFWTYVDVDENEPVVDKDGHDDGKDEPVSQAQVDEVLRASQEESVPEVPEGDTVVEDEPKTMPDM